MDMAVGMGKVDPDIENEITNLLYFRAGSMIFWGVWGKRRLGLLVALSRKHVSKLL
jgi:hypothetical protein